MKKRLISLTLFSVIFIGCGEVNINMADYPNRVRQPIIVPDVCKNEYKALKDIPRIAVVKFTNNSSFSKANTTTSNKNENYSHAGAAGIAVGANGIGIAEADKSHLDTHTNSVNRVVEPKLDKAISSALEGSLVEMGGAQIYSRSDLDKVMKEQKLQQSGLFDEKTLAEVGKLTGINYIVTGSIDSVTQEFKDYRKAGDAAARIANSGNQKQNTGSILTSAALKIGATAASGMKITTRATIKIIDVKTGKILFSAPIEETKNIGMIPNPTYTQIIGAIKENLIEGIKDLKPKLSQYFALSGYIIQIKSDNKH
jgi:curli biogenesis system outer membrane secretion channel CsgG